jgi:hypothetical protein
MSNDDTNIKINNLWERLCLGLLSFIVSCLFLFYQGQREDFKGLEEKVVTMQTGKVNKEDLREVEARLNTKMDAGFSNLIARSAQDKADVISRLDLYFSQVKNTKR